MATTPPAVVVQKQSARQQSPHTSNALLQFFFAIFIVAESSFDFTVGEVPMERAMCVLYRFLSAFARHTSRPMEEGKAVFALAAALVLYFAGHGRGLPLSGFPKHADPGSGKSVQHYLVGVAEVARDHISPEEIPSDDQFQKWMKDHWIEIRKYAKELVKQTSAPGCMLIDAEGKLEMHARFDALDPDYAHPSMADGV